MPAKPIYRTPSAFSYQLLIKNILTTPLIYAPKQEIVYRDRLRYDYETFFKRVTRLAGMLQQQGVQPGDTVAIMDWDSHRYLECFFAVPMMGAVLHTINIRLFGRAAHLHHQPRRRRCHPGQCRIFTGCSKG